MIAEIQRLEQGYIACSERHIEHSVTDVWAMLTDNEKLEKWFQELRVGELCEGGFMEFDMSEGKFEQLEILEYKALAVLAFDWFGDTVRFKLSPEPKGCLLTFTEKFNIITDQTIKDLAGWHICLDVIESLLNDKPMLAREEEWKKCYEKYKQAMS